MKETKAETPKRTRNANGAGSIYQRKDGRYCGQIQIGTKQNGKPDIKYVYGKTPKEAQKKLDNLKILYATSEKLKDNIIVDKTYKDMYIDEYFLRWLRDDKFNSLQPTSYDTLENTVLNHIIPAIGHFKMDGEISPEILTDSLITKPYRKGLSYSTVKKNYVATKECFTRAKLLDHITTNPMEKVKMMPSEKFSFEDEELKIFTDDEIESFKQTVDLKNSKGNYIYKMGYIFIFVLNTGVRSGELLSLKWKDIDLKNKIVHIRANLSEALDRDENGERIEEEDGTLKKVVLNKRTKTRSGKRTIPLNNNAINALDIIKSQRYFGENSYIFSTANKKSVGKKSSYNMFNRILERANIDQCGLHVLRHTFASMQLRNGVDIAVVSRLLGHASVSITYDIYIHIIEEQKTMAVNLTNI